MESEDEFDGPAGYTNEEGYTSGVDFSDDEENVEIPMNREEEVPVVDEEVIRLEEELFGGEPSTTEPVREEPTRAESPKLEEKSNPLTTLILRELRRDNKLDRPLDLSKITSEDIRKVLTELNINLEDEEILQIIIEIRDIDSEIKVRRVIATLRSRTRKEGEINDALIKKVIKDLKYDKLLIEDVKEKLAEPVKERIVGMKPDWKDIRLQKFEKKGLFDLDLKQLKELAQRYGIVLPNKTDKKVIIRLIKAYSDELKRNFSKEREDVESLQSLIDLVSSPSISKERLENIARKLGIEVKTEYKSDDIADSLRNILNNTTVKDLDIPRMQGLVDILKKYDPDLDMKITPKGSLKKYRRDIATRIDQVITSLEENPESEKSLEGQEVLRKMAISLGVTKGDKSSMTKEKRVKQVLDKLTTLKELVEAETDNLEEVTIYPDLEVTKYGYYKDVVEKPEKIKREEVEKERRVRGEGPFVPPPSLYVDGKLYTDKIEATLAFKEGLISAEELSKYEERWDTWRKINSKPSTVVSSSSTILSDRATGFRKEMERMGTISKTKKVVNPNLEVVWKDSLKARESLWGGLEKIPTDLRTRFLKAVDVTPYTKDPNVETLEPIQFESWVNKGFRSEKHIRDEDNKIVVRKGSMVPFLREVDENDNYIRPSTEDYDGDEPLLLEDPSLSSGFIGRKAPLMNLSKDLFSPEEYYNDPIDDEFVDFVVNYISSKLEVLLSKRRVEKEESYSTSVDDSYKRYIIDEKIEEYEEDEVLLDLMLDAQHDNEAVIAVYQYRHGDDIFSVDSKEIWRRLSLYQNPTLLDLRIMDVLKGDLNVRGEKLLEILAPIFEEYGRVEVREGEKEIDVVKNILKERWINDMLTNKKEKTLFLAKHRGDRPSSKREGGVEGIKSQSIRDKVKSYSSKIVLKNKVKTIYEYLDKVLLPVVFLLPPLDKYVSVSPSGDRKVIEKTLYRKKLDEDKIDISKLHTLSRLDIFPEYYGMEERSKDQYIKEVEKYYKDIVIVRFERETRRKTLGEGERDDTGKLTFNPLKMRNRSWRRIVNPRLVEEDIIIKGDVTAICDEETEESNIIIAKTGKEFTCHDISLLVEQFRREDYTNYTLNVEFEKDFIKRIKKRYL